MRSGLQRCRPRSARGSACSPAMWPDGPGAQLSRRMRRKSWRNRTSASWQSSNRFRYRTAQSRLLCRSLRRSLMPLQRQASRLFRYVELQPGAKSGEGQQAIIPEVVPEEEANLVGSLTTRGTHMPVLDIDRIPVRLVESSTPGNYHLYIDKEMPWETYLDLLWALVDAGILERGWV